MRYRIGVGLALGVVLGVLALWTRSYWRIDGFFRESSTPLRYNYVFVNSNYGYISFGRTRIVGERLQGSLPQGDFVDCGLGLRYASHAAIEVKLPIWKTSDFDVIPSANAMQWSINVPYWILFVVAFLMACWYWRNLRLWARIDVGFEPIEVRKE